MPITTVDMLNNGRRIYFISDSKLKGKNYGVLDDPKPWDTNGEVIYVSPAVFSFLEDQEMKGKIYEKLQIKDGEKTRWIMDIMMGVG